MINQRVVKKIKGPWYHKRFNGYPMTLGMVEIGCVQNGCRNLPWSITLSVVFTKAGVGDWYWNKPEQLRLREKTIKAQIKDPYFIIRIDKLRRSEQRKFDRAVVNFCKKELSSLNNIELWQAYDRVIRPFAEAWGYGVISEPFLDESHDWLKEELEDEFRLKFGVDWANKLRVASFPIGHSFSNEERISLLKIAVLIERYRIGSYRKAVCNKYINHLLNIHTKSYYWIEDNYGVYKKLSAQDFYNRALVLSKNNPRVELANIKKFRLKAMREKKGVLPKISTKGKSLILLSDMLTSGSDHRKTLVFKSAKVWFTLAREVAHRFRLTENDLLNLSHLELKDLLYKGQVNKAQLKLRHKSCLALCSPTEYHLFEGKNLHLKIDDFEEKVENPSVVHGLVASSGTARGKVRVVIMHTDIAKVKIGEILVTNNTTPDYVPAMRKAAAIVTEQGGITSHAALVSRELGVPCVIGTKIVTKIFKTGDRVEVDANKGIIRRI